MAALLAVGGAYALASWDWCGHWAQAPATLVAKARAHGALSAGAAAVELEPPWPVTIAGYGPLRPTAVRANRPLRARAVVLQVGEVKAAVVTLDVLLVPQAVVEEVRRASGLPDAWVVATHTHSSFGGYDPRPLAQLAGTGWDRPSAEQALVRGAGLRSWRSRSVFSRGRPGSTTRGPRASTSGSGATSPRSIVC